MGLATYNRLLLSALECPVPLLFIIVKWHHFCFPSICPPHPCKLWWFLLKTGHAVVGLWIMSSVHSVSHGGKWISIAHLCSELCTRGQVCGWYGGPQVFCLPSLSMQQLQGGRWGCVSVIYLCNGEDCTLEDISFPNHIRQQGKTQVFVFFLLHCTAWI